MRSYDAVVGHKGNRDGGPPRKPGFRPEDVVGLPARQALLELTHEGYDVVTDPPEQPRFADWRSNRVRMAVHDGLVTEVVVG
jgi:hypothetical protein